MVLTLKFQLLLLPHDLHLFSKQLVISLNGLFTNPYLFHRMSLKKSRVSVQSSVMKHLFSRTWSLHERDSEGSSRTLSFLNTHNFFSTIFLWGLQEWLHYALYFFSCHYYGNPSLPHHLSHPLNLWFFHILCITLSALNSHLSISWNFFSGFWNSVIRIHLYIPTIFSKVSPLFAISTTQFLLWLLFICGSIRWWW